MNHLLARLKHPRFTTYRQFAMFVAVGILNTVFGYSVFALFIFMKLHYAIAMLLATCLGILFNFNTTGRIVFQQHDRKMLVQFIGAYTFIYFITLILFNITKLLHITNIYTSGAIISLITPFISFYLNKYYVFIHRESLHNS